MPIARLQHLFSMILAGVLLKMAGYGIIRMNIEMLPDAHLYFAPVLAILGVINIVYASMTAFGQDNLKRRMAYSSGRSYGLRADWAVHPSLIWA